MAKSIPEAEYMAASSCTDEALWIQQLLTDIGRKIGGTTLLDGDNQGCLALAKNPVNHGRAKHIDIKHHSIRERIENNLIRYEYIATEDMVADILTKGLSKAKT